ncbi:MAG: XRE family transcriptional regulator [Planctomycetes bacterium]|nr:XRE family transcriptional regulator [Planctomycetota bacterium]
MPKDFDDRGDGGEIAAAELGPITVSTRHQRATEVRRRYDFSVIRTLRQQKGLTIEKFARECGLSYAPISRIETNLIKPNLDTLDRIAEGLGITTFGLLALAERTETSVQNTREVRAGAFHFQAITLGQTELLLGQGRRGAVAVAPELGTAHAMSIVVHHGVLVVDAKDKRLVLTAGQALALEGITPSRLEAEDDCDFAVLILRRA